MRAEEMAKKRIVHAEEMAKKCTVRAVKKGEETHVDSAGIRTQSSRRSARAAIHHGATTECYMYVNQQSVLIEPKPHQPEKINKYIRVTTNGTSYKAPQSPIGAA